MSDQNVLSEHLIHRDFHSNEMNAASMNSTFCLCRKNILWRDIKKNMKTKTARLGAGFFFFEVQMYRTWRPNKRFIWLPIFLGYLFIHGMKWSWSGSKTSEWKRKWDGIQGLDDSAPRYSVPVTSWAMIDLPAGRLRYSILFSWRQPLGIFPSPWEVADIPLSVKLDFKNDVDCASQSMGHGTIKHPKL